MCGRFFLYTPIEVIKEKYSISEDNIPFVPRYNIAPSQQILAVINDGTRNKVGYLKWGLIPSWAKDEKVGYKMINARAETLSEKPSFRQAYQKRRCLIIANGFFEWKKEGSSKVPMCIRLKDSEPFSMAGLWERWRSPLGGTVYSCAIVTTRPNELMDGIHDRMPVIIPKASENIWLDQSLTDPNVLDNLLIPYQSNFMEAYQVSTLVNSPQNDRAEILLSV